PGRPRSRPYPGRDMAPDDPPGPSPARRPGRLVGLRTRLGSALTMAADQPAPETEGPASPSGETDEHGGAEAPPEPKPTLVLLVRHGKTPTTGSVRPGRAPGRSRAEEGKDQAKAAAERVAGLEGVTAVYASPLERTQETAAPIAEALGLEVRTEAGLLECEFGEWTGAELKALFKLPEWRPAQTSPSTFRSPGGVSFPELQAAAPATVQHGGAPH